ncbi:PDZ domain-containing protein, partial [uncultured Acinetobacter sp.]
AELTGLEIKGGVVIQDIRPGGIAAQARIMPNDVITQVNNAPIQDTNGFIEAVSELKKGTVARVTLIRQGQRAIVGMRIS